ncbi:MAG: hypothetical protein IMF06_10930 [Proteobacteria bacterium]|nr:hypothetical protein [Pseudomonadota bacterium]
MVRVFIDSMPLWGVLVTTIIIVWVANEVGFRVGVSRSRGPGSHNETQITSMTGANLGLLAFLLAFTFSMAANHYDNRKNIILGETKVISTSYLRTRLLPGDQGEDIRALLLQYTVLRAGVGDETSAMMIIKQSEILQEQMWQEIEALTAGEKPTVTLSLLIQSINKIFEIHEDRVTAGLHNRIPPSIWVALYVVLLLSMVGMGFHSGIKGSRSPVPSATLALSFSMVLFLIADLDRPSSGLVKPDQTSMIALGERLQQQE